MSAPNLESLGGTERAMVDLAASCELRITPPEAHDGILSFHAALADGDAAAKYVSGVETSIHARRRSNLPSGTPPPTDGAVTASELRPAPSIDEVRASHVPTRPTSTSRGLAAILGLVPALMVLAGWMLTPAAGYVSTLALLALMLVGIGKSVLGRAAGVLINERNLMSLARFQAVVWTVIVLASYLTYALARLRAMMDGGGSSSITDALAIGIDWPLWALMGISTTSLVGTPLILSTKLEKQPTDAATTHTAALLGEDAPSLRANKQGSLYANGATADARFTDMFEGEEIGNAAQIDLAKVQMFFFTIIAALSYVVTVGVSLAGRRGDWSALPTVSPGLLAILSISHVGYLTSKSIDRTPLQPPRSGS